MDAKQMWEKFLLTQNVENLAYSAWAFGITEKEADDLAALVWKGIKTATTSAYPLYKLRKEALPQKEEYSVILDSKKEAVCIIQNRKVTVVPYQNISAEYAYKEGEGDRTLAYWRQVHKEFFQKELEKVHLEFDEKMEVVCEEFEVVYREIPIRDCEL